MNEGLEALNILLKRQNDLEKYGSAEILSIKQNRKLLETIEKELKAIRTISTQFKLVGNCLHARNKYAEDGWVFVKELEDEEEHNAWKDVLLV